MKLINVVKWAIPAIVFFSACSYRSESDLLRGHWRYVSISKEDSSFIDVSEDDFFYLDSNGFFSYHIQSVKKTMNGQWTYNDDTLHLKYIKPDTIRHFKVKLLSRRDLEITENDVVFRFNRNPQ